MFTVTEEAGSGRAYYTVGVDGTVLGTHTATRHEPVKPFLVLGYAGRELLKALAAAVTDTMPIEHATQIHLKDATQVRDRLLTIVEQTMEARIGKEA